jgi:hypothetical protein
MMQSSVSVINAAFIYDMFSKKVMKGQRTDCVSLLIFNKSIALHQSAEQISYLLSDMEAEADLRMVFLI